MPERRVSNAELASKLGVDEAWIAKRTGTRERPWATGAERMTEFAARAGRDALVRAGLAPDQLDLVLVATSSADEITPNAAPLVAGLIGASRAGAFDVGSACTGWLAALAMACGQIESGRAQHALVVVQLGVQEAIGRHRESLRGARPGPGCADRILAPRLAPAAPFQNASERLQAASGLSRAPCRRMVRAPAVRRRIL